jgi:ABC-2 type transport system permease protein
MSATSSAPAAPALARATRIGRVTQARVARSEWTKLRSLRSTRWALLVTLLLIIGIGILACTVFESRWPNLSPEDKARFLIHRLRVNLAGVGIAQLSVGVLGVLVISGEYSTGMIRSTFCAVPKRLPVLWAKVAVFAAVTFAVTLPAVVVVFFAGQSILSGRHLQISFSDPGVARAVIGSALFLTVMGVFGLGIGAIVRHTAGGIVTLVGIMFVLPPILGLLPSSWSDAINPYLPSNAGGSIWTVTPDPHTLSPWAGFALFCGYAAASLLIAAVLMRRRDT